MPWACFELAFQVVIAQRFGCRHPTIIDSPRDTSRQEPSRPVTCYDTTRWSYWSDAASCSRLARGWQRRHCASPSSLCCAVLPRPYVGPVRTDRRRNGRQWRLQCWHGVLFSDESRFHLRNADGRAWRRRGERYHNDCLVQAD